MALTRDLSCGSRCCSPGVRVAQRNIRYLKRELVSQRERETAHGRGMQSGLGWRNDREVSLTPSSFALLAFQR